MENESKVLNILKGHLKLITQTVDQFDDYDVERGIGDLNEILNAIKNNQIKIKSSDGSSKGVTSNQPDEETQKDAPKKRGRKTKNSVLSTTSVPSRPKELSEALDSLDDSFTSVSSSSSRTRRAAAQVAESKTRVQSSVPLNTKLRRPTNFDEKQAKAVNPPPAKCRRTRRNQSAGNSSQPDESNEELCNEKMIVDNDEISEDIVNKKCTVSLEKLKTPIFKALTNPHCRLSRSLDRVCKSGDLFNDSDSSGKKDISLNEEEKESQPIAQSSPLPVETVDGGFRGFGDQTFVVGNKTEETQVLLKKTHKKQAHGVSCEEVEETEINIRSRTKTLQKKEMHSVIDIEEKENLNKKNETYIAGKSDSPNLRSRTKVLKKARHNQGDEEGDIESSSSPEIIVVQSQKKPSKDELNLDCDGGQSVRSRTRVIKKADDKDKSDNKSSDASSRIETIVKEANVGLDSKCLLSDFKDNPPAIRAERAPPFSPASAKGELVKKRIEVFEKMQNGVEEMDEEITVGRVTRNAVKSKVAVSSKDVSDAKLARKMMQSPAPNKKKIRNSVGKGKRDKVKEGKENVPVAKVQSGNAKQPERLKMTPLGVNNRMTPGPDSSHRTQTNKVTSSTQSRHNTVESNKHGLVQKQTAEEAERKRKEEESLKRKAKEEEAKKKKEKVLKATAEEARRKREEKLQKVAATREAAEKEKERQAAKAEKERVEKMKQITMEKEKQKEEYLKKKQLMQQKTLEHEERRKQEEAARLAKIKEQEEEQKRLDALKEREQELQKQHKAELRLAEAEKIKQGGKLGKIATLNNAKLKLQGATPSEKTYGNQPTTSYEITPSREDRPPLPPKTENDYGIDDALSGDSSDDESQPKKKIPEWAKPDNRQKLLEANRYIPKELWSKYMQCDSCPDINKIFAGAPMRKRIRTSSAVWNTPPKLY